jgi:hypothetical protein
VADIIEFPIAGRSHPSAETTGALRAGIGRLADATEALQRSRARLERQYDVLGTVKDLLEAQMLYSQAIAALALSIETAIAAGDLASMIMLQAELKSLMARAAAPLPQSDAAD